MSNHKKEIKNTLGELEEEMPEEKGVYTETITVKMPEDEAVDILEYLNEPNIRLGIDNRKTIIITTSEGRKVKGIIRPLSSDEVIQFNNLAEESKTSADKLVISHAFYAMDGKTHIPDLALEKFAAGVNAQIVSKIMEFSGYGIDAEEVEYLKKN